MVDLSGASPASGEHTTVVGAHVESGPSGGTRRWLAGVVAAAVIAVVGLVALLSGGDSDDVNDAASPTPTTIADGSSGAVARPPANATTTTESPSTTEVPTTTERRAPPTLAPTTTIAYIGQRIGPVLAQSQNGRSLYVADRQKLHRIDLGTGAVTTVEPSTELGITGATLELFGVEHGRLVLVSQGNSVAAGPTMYHLALDLTGPLVELPLDGFEGYLSTAGTIWYAEPGGFMQGQDFRRLALDGSVADSFQVPDGWPWAVLIEDNAVMIRGGRLWTVGADGQPEAFATGEFVASNGRHVMWEECNDAGQCAYVVQAPGRDDRRSFASLPSGIRGGWLSPDGTHLVTYSRSGDQVIVDLGTGGLQEMPYSDGGVQPAWSPDGRYFCYARDAMVLAIDVETGDRIPFDFDLLGPNPFGRIIFG